MTSDFTIPVQHFDTSLLPPEARQIGTEAFKVAVALHYVVEYAARGEIALVTVNNEEISVKSFSAESTALDFIIPMLKAGQIAEAVPYLESLTKSAPASATVLYNLGIAYIDLKQYDEAIIRLKRAVQLDPAHAHAWVGIGNAYHLMGKPAQALAAAETAVGVDSGDGYARRTLGAILIGLNRAEDAVVQLRAALECLPGDEIAIFDLAVALAQVGTGEADEEADELNQRIIEEHPTSGLVERAKTARTKFSHKNVKARSIAGFRPDVMMYIVAAMRTFKELGPEKRRVIGLEIAVLGTSGLDVNSSEAKYVLKSLPGKFSGIHLLSIMYTAFREIDPTLDSGVDFSTEYKAALAMQPNL